MTKEMSATTRMVLDSVRTLVIWGVSLGVGWQKFQFLQLIGFLILVTGMCVYNDLLIGMCNKELYLLNLYLLCIDLIDDIYFSLFSL